MGYIYLRTNLINGKKYVGQAKNIKERNYAWKNLNKSYGGCVINNARKKYGPDGFSFEILKECEDEELNYWEMYYIKMYNSKKPYGYNSTDGGDSTYERTEETRKKIGDTLRGRKLSEETKAKLSAAMRGRKRPDISAAKRGKHYPKISAAKRGKPNPKLAAARRGMKLSEETRKKMSDAQKTSEKAKIARAKSAAVLRGRKHSPEHIAKVAAAKRGKYNTKKSKAVQALDPNTLEVVMEFPSTREAQRHGFSHGNVAACCHNCFNRPGNNVYKGFIWRFAV